MSDLFDLVRRMVLDAGQMSPALAILLRVTLLLAAAASVSLALRRSSAALRHLVWTLALVGTILIPLGYAAFPAWQWAVLPSRQTAVPIASAHAAVRSSLSDAHIAQAGARAMESESFPAGAGTLRAISSTPPPHILASAVPAAAPEVEWPWQFILISLWATGTLAGIVWLAVGVLAAARVARRAATADSLWQELLTQLLAECDRRVGQSQRSPTRKQFSIFGPRTRVDARQSPHVSVPMTWGLRRPVILVPAGSETWPTETMRSVLLHELGHIRRGDCLVHLVGRLASALYWFHPLMWLAVRQLRTTSEQAADDVVLSASVAPPTYAEHLVGIAAQLRGVRVFAHAALPMAGRSDLEGRVLAILDPRQNHGSLKRKTGYALMVLAAVVVIPCAILRLGYADQGKSQDRSIDAEDGRRSYAERLQTAELATPGHVADAPRRPLANASVKRGISLYDIRHKASQSERSLAAALDWLYRHQAERGQWSLAGFDKQCKGAACSGRGIVRSDSEATALALLTFLAAGQTQKSTGPYQHAIAKGIDWLIEQQDSEGDLSGKCDLPMHAHGIAAIALCSAFGMTKDAKIGTAAQKAVDYIGRAQNQSTGGWRYLSKDAGDTTEFGWQIMALKSAQCAGLKVVKNVLENAKKWLRAVAKGDHFGLYSFRPDEEATPDFTAVGMFCSQCLGVGRSDPAMLESSKYLLANLPNDKTRNTHYWFFATLAMHGYGGHEQDTWNRKLRQVLIQSQINKGCAAGSWDPAKPTRDAFGERDGRLATTCLSVIALEVYCRYLPLTQLDKSESGEPIGAASEAIIAGVGWKNVRVGMKREDLIEALGKPDNDPASNVLHWAAKHIDCSFHPGSSVVANVGFNPGFAGVLANGIKLGSAGDEMLRLYGKPEVIDPHNTAGAYEYSSKGILFCIYEQKITQIVVFKPNTHFFNRPKPADRDAGAKAAPQIVSTSPAAGATDVDPSTAEITVTFDQGMGRGFSWTGGGPYFPTLADDKKPFWRDARTCVLSVKLERGRFYRVGIQSDSFRNFRSSEGVPALPSAIYFTTPGAGEKEKDRLRKPKIVAIVPTNGAKNVDPSLGELRVTFDRPMGPGFSWTGSGPAFPTSPEGKAAYWTEDRKTCVLPVELKPGRQYRLGLNSPSFINFQSESGVPLEPVVYTFATLDRRGRDNSTKSVSMGGYLVTDADLARLEGMTQLQSLNLANSQVTDAGLERLKGLTNLQSLNLTFTKVTDAGLERIKGLTTLQSLSLHGIGVTDAGLLHLKGLTRLRSLSLYGTKVTEAGLAQLKAFAQLESLDLGATRITGSGLVHLKALTKLESLELIWTNVSDAGLEQLKGFTRLRSLNLWGIRPQVTDAGLERLKELTNLQSLNLGRSGVTDVGLGHLKGMTKLQSLNLAETNVTDAGLEQLKGLTKLQSLGIWATKVTDMGKKQPQETLPHCRIQ